VAGRARCRRRGHVRSSQRESGDTVIEGRGVPASGGVACGAIGGGKGSAGSGVNWIVGSLPGRQMALRIPAIGWRDR